MKLETFSGKKPGEINAVEDVNVRASQTPFEVGCVEPRLGKVNMGIVGWRKAHRLKLPEVSKL